MGQDGAGSDARWLETVRQEVIRFIPENQRHAAHVLADLLDVWWQQGQPQEAHPTRRVPWMGVRTVCPHSSA
jgi:hypothetical protein